MTLDIRQGAKDRGSPVFLHEYFRGKTSIRLNWDRVGREGAMAQMPQASTVFTEI